MKSIKIIKTKEEVLEKIDKTSKIIWLVTYVVMFHVICTLIGTIIYLANRFDLIIAPDFEMPILLNLGMAILWMCGLIVMFITNRYYGISYHLLEIKELLRK